MTLIAVMMALSAMLAWGVAVWIRRSAETLRLVQIPNHRSSHVQPTPNGGGLGIVVAGSLAGIALVLFSDWSIGWFVLGFAALLAVVGLRDDIQHLPARVRFGVQVSACAGLLFSLGDLPSISFGTGLEFEINGWVLSGLLLLTNVWWINLFNFMDGIDGIAGAFGFGNVLVPHALKLALDTIQRGVVKERRGDKIAVLGKTVALRSGNLAHTDCFTTP